MGIKKFLEANYKIIVFLVLTFMLAVSLLNAWNDSAIFDETAHIGAAYTYVTQHEIRLNPEHPPLIKDLAGIPLLFLNLKFDVNQPFWDGSLPGKWDEGQWAAGRSLLYGSGNNPDAIIFWARFPIVLLSLIFGLFLFRWGKELAGTLAGLLVLIFYAFDPNILGHDHFVTTDLGIAAFMAFSFYYYLKFVKFPNWKNVLLAGIFVGLLMLAKFSFIIILPIFALATIIFPLVSHIDPEEKNRFIARTKKLGEYISKGALVFLISLVVVWVVYAGNTFKMQKETVSQVIEANFPVTNVENPKEIYTNKVLHWLNDHPATRPLTDFGIGISYVFRRVSGGNGAYFMGQVSSKGFRAYFPTVFLIKESIPALFFMLFALILGLIKIISTFRKSLDDFFRKNLRNILHYLRTHIVEFSMLLFIFLYAYVSITGNLNIGFRHLFPILPFIYILTARGIANFLKNKVPRHKTIASYGHNSPEARELSKHEARETQKIHIFSIVFSLIFSYLILGTISAYPNYMSYFNETVGGPKNGYHYVTDSNADWGQDLKRLQGFLDDNPQIGLIRVDYFGGGDISYYIGDKYEQWYDSKRPIEAGWYAVSTNFLEGSLYDTAKPDNESYRWLKYKKPLYQVGTSILIYYITPQEAANIN
ncbi:MAG: glycosyltransferase family 39 protein [Parcubacteria group bacterium]|jgi:hypothetical protein